VVTRTLLTAVATSDDGQETRIKWALLSLHEKIMICNLKYILRRNNRQKAN
jgi:hypothetical protein